VFGYNLIGRMFKVKLFDKVKKRGNVYMKRCNIEMYLVIYTTLMFPEGCKRTGSRRTGLRRTKCRRTG
jgi:hypothetical protein